MRQKNALNMYVEDMYKSAEDQTTKLTDLEVSHDTHNSLITKEISSNFHHLRDHIKDQILISDNHISETNSDLDKLEIVVADSLNSLNVINENVIAAEKKRSENINAKITTSLQNGTSYFYFDLFYHYTCNCSVYHWKDF